MTAATVTHGGATSPDGVLVQEAAAGSGVSYGALYDRYATQVYNYCLRLTGSPEDAADATQEAFVNVLRRLQEDDRPVVEFASYLFAAARNESYSLMRQRSRMTTSESPPEEPGRVSEVETDPERAALLRDTQEAVQEANARLAPRYREVLALREIGGLSYEQVGQIMGISANAAAQLIWRARSRLREALTAGAVASVVATSEECEWAQQLINRVEDGEPVDHADRVWLEEHLEDCGSCQTASRMLLEAGASYRLWLPVALLAGMRAETLTAAGHLVGADWSQIAASGHAAGSSAGGGGGSGGVLAAAGAVIVAAGIAFLALTGDDKPRTVSAPAETPAAETPAAPAKSRPARRPPGPKLVAARAPRATPPAAKPPAPKLQRSDQPAIAQAPLAPRPRGHRPAAPPQPPSKGSPAPPPPEPKAEPPPLPAVPPVAPPANACAWPGGGNGPGGCPPGHGGVPPGQGGTPPGLESGIPPGRSR